MELNLLRSLVNTALTSTREYERKQALEAIVRSYDDGQEVTMLEDVLLLARNSGYRQASIVDMA